MSFASGSGFFYAKVRKVSFWGYFNSYRTSTGELTSLSQAQLAARELAVARLQREAMLLGAHGVIGVSLQLKDYDWSAHVIEFFTVGTAVIVLRSDHHIPTPQLMLSVND